MLARSSGIIVNYEGVDITDELNKDLLSFVYTDNASGSADSISISLKDEKKKWMYEWAPRKGDIIEASIKTVNWRKNGDKQILPCGRFFVDEPQYSGRPSVMTLGAISTPQNSNFTGTKRTRSWRNISLSNIANDIARRYGMTLQFFGANNPFYVSLEQLENSDSAFLAEQCENEGLAMKVTDQKIIIFDEKEFERRASVATYHEWNDTVLSYSFKSSDANTSYAGVNVIYYDPILGQTIEYLFALREVDPEKDKVYQINTKVSSKEEAIRVAQRTLRKLNKDEYEGYLTVVGNVDLLGGCCIDLESFGSFSGKYYIVSATHSKNPSYTTEVTIRKVLEGY